jgi:tetratricopeptide (TPR) repeat protein
MPNAREAARRVALVLSLALAAGLLAGHALFAGDDKKLPKKPDRPLSVAVTASPRPEAKTEAEAKSAKELSDSIADIQKNLREKRRDWFTVVDDANQAEIVLEVKGRGWEADHGAVVEGRVFVLDMQPARIIGQGGLNPGGLSFSYWRQAASDITGRLQGYCQRSYEDLRSARQKGVRPISVIENDRGVDLFRKDDNAGALGAFDAAIRLAPNFPPPYFNRGLVHETTKDYEKAIADFDATLRLDPGHKKANHYRGIAHRERGELEPARADFSEAIRIDPKNADAYLARAGVLRSLGDQKAAIGDLDQAVSLGGARKSEALALRGLAYQSLADSDKALADFDAALAAGPETAALHYNRGRVLLAKGDNRACGAFRAAAALGKDDADILFERGLCSAKLGELDKAVADFSECVRLRPDMAIAYWNRSICYTRQKKAKPASVDKAQALKLDPKLAAKK